MKLRSIRDWRLPMAIVLLLTLAVGFILKSDDPTPATGWWGKSVRTAGAPAVWLAQGVEAIILAPFDGKTKANLEARDEELVELRAEVAALRAEISVARQELKDWRTGKDSGRGGSTLDVVERFRFLAADVIGRQPQPRRQSIRLNRGERHGVEINLPVVSDEGLIGVVRELDDNSCLVQLVTDPFFAVAAEEGAGLWQAVVLGRGAERPLRLEPHEPILDPEVGVAVKTSGLGGSLFPRGLLIGNLREGDTERSGLETLALEPAADLDTRFVLIILSW